MKKSKNSSEGGPKYFKQERASLRHRSNNKFAQVLKRYADKTAVQNVQTSLNMQRKDVINKLKELHNDFDKIDSSYDEEEVR
jgi:hypothetical protein